MKRRRRFAVLFVSGAAQKGVISHKPDMTERMKVAVKFFSKSNGGRSQLPPDLLSCGTYRPHLVVERLLKEEYLGVLFVSQSEPLAEEKQVVAEVNTIYPEVDYSSLATGVTFTIREGGSVVGTGEVLQKGL